MCFILKEALLERWEVFLSIVLMLNIHLFIENRILFSKYCSIFKTINYKNTFYE